jgi:hypothetical protein
MPRLNLEATLDYLEGLHARLQLCYELSRNNELTEELAIVMDRLSGLITTITNLINLE